MRRGYAVRWLDIIHEMCIKMQKHRNLRVGGQNGNFGGLHPKGISSLRSGHHASVRTGSQ